MWGNIRALARLVIIDGLRRHALLGLILLSLAAETGGLLFMDFIPRDIGRATNDFILSVGWVTGFLFLLFHAVQVMAWDEERRTIHTLLARPISRAQYVLGVYLGLALLLALLNTILALLGYGILLWVQSTVKAIYFSSLNGTYYLLAWLGLSGIEFFVLSIILFFSGLVRGGFPVLLLTLSYYGICNGLPVVRESLRQTPGEQVQTMTSLLKWLTLLFPDFSRFDVKSLVIDADASIAPYILTNFALLLFTCTVVLWLTCFIYQRRDLQ